jgi:hypothetical protein
MISLRMECNGSKLEDIAPLVFMIPLRMRWNVKGALANDVWISTINMNI